MRANGWLTCFASLLALASAGARSQTPRESPLPTGYQAKATFPLAKAADGGDGRLELLIDSRITPDIRGADLTAPLLDADSALQQRFSPAPPRNAELRIVDARGRVVQSKKLVPVADLETASLYGNRRRSFLLTLDLSSGFGSYSGPLTSVLDVTDGRWREIQATDAVTGKTAPIALMKSLKTDWMLAPRGNATDFLLVSCRPNLDDVSKKDAGVAFSTTYTRIRFDGREWVAYSRTQEGEFWESDADFPADSAFPSAP